MTYGDGSSGDKRYDDIYGNSKCWGANEIDQWERVDESNCNNGGYCFENGSNCGGWDHYAIFDLEDSPNDDAIGYGSIHFPKEGQGDPYVSYQSNKHLYYDHGQIITATH